MRKIAVLCSAVVLLSSCIGIDSRMSIRDDGSGTLALTYRISRLISELGVASTGKAAIPLPVSRSDFERSLAGTHGTVRLTRFDRSDDDKDITVHADLAFDSVADLANVEAFQDAQLRWSVQGSRHLFSQLIVRAPRQPLSDDSRRMLEALFEGYNLSFVIEAPRPISGATLGTLSADKRTLTYTTSVKDALMSGKDLALSAQW
jgi:hypothetical protein